MIDQLPDEILVKIINLLDYQDCKQLTFAFPFVSNYVFFKCNVEKIKYLRKARELSSFHVNCIGSSL